jgi:hypothetical protein
MDGCSSEWSYFTPYEADISAALQRLREEVFARGDYVLGHGFPQKDFDATRPVFEKLAKEMQIRAEDTSLSELTRFGALQMAEHAKRELEKYWEASPKGEIKPKVIKKPKTIDELLKQQAEIGTHSILDITQISATPKRKAISRLPDSVLADFCLSGTPSRAEIEDVYELGSLEKYVNKRWRGIYIIAYKDDKASEIFFAGCSGD